MTIHVAAVTHCDPLARIALLRWIGRAALRCEERPKFVAVEWGANAFVSVKAQRARFRDIARIRWPDASPRVLDELSLTLGFEGDSHSDMWPDVPTIWLDNDRPLTATEQNTIELFAEQRLVIYRSWLEDLQPPPDADAALLFFSAMAETVTRAVAMPDGFARDLSWADAIGSSVEPGPWWGVAVVGEAHAGEPSKSFASELRKRGYDVARHNMFTRY